MAVERGKRFAASRIHFPDKPDRPAVTVDFAAPGIAVCKCNPASASNNCLWHLAEAS